MSVVTGVTAETQADESGSSRSACTDCSHCANRSRIRTRAGVRVSVNLRQFFSDQRARAFMWVPYGRCVQWLIRRVARVFGLPDDIALMSRGHVLPGTEPLLMLDRDDPLEVINRSFMFTPDNKQDYENGNSQRNMSISQENIGQLQTGRYRVTEQKNDSRVEYPVESPVETSIASMECQSVDENGDLQRLKQRALRLLDEHCHVQQEQPPAKRRRRRRRRRLIAGPASDVEEPRCSAEQISSHHVLRNGSGSRAPRIVRALSQSPIPQYVL